MTIQDKIEEIKDVADSVNRILDKYPAVKISIIEGCPFGFSVNVGELEND